MASLAAWVNGGRGWRVTGQAVVVASQKEFGERGARW